MLIVTKLTSSYFFKLINNLFFCNFIQNNKYAYKDIKKSTQSVIHFFCIFNVFFFLNFSYFYQVHFFFYTYLVSFHFFFYTYLVSLHSFFFSLKHFNFIFLIWSKLKFSKKIVIKFTNHNLFISISNYDLFHYQLVLSMGNFLVSKSKFIDAKEADKKKVEFNWYDEQMALYLSSLKAKSRKKVKIKKLKNKYLNRYGIKTRKIFHHFKTLLVHKIFHFFLKFKYRKIFFFHINSFFDFFFLKKKNKKKLKTKKNLYKKKKIKKSFFRLFKKVNNFYVFFFCYQSTSHQNFFYPNLLWSNRFLKSSNILYGTYKIDRIHLIFKNFTYNSFIRHFLKFFFTTKLNSTFIQYLENNFTLKCGGTKFRKPVRGTSSV